jgi:2-hydroxychromene-2-carboxylate isomerase
MPAKFRLYVQEHINKAGLSDTQLARRMQIDRARTRPERLDSTELSRLAEAIGLESHFELYFPPGTISLDAMVADLPKATREHLAEIISSFVKRGR